MKLIGMLDSPFVRRIAVTLRWLDIDFEHQVLSVFADYEKFSGINPLVKAPSFVCDDGTALMESSLILQYVELYTSAPQSLHRQDAAQRQWLLRVLGLAQVTGEKLVQLYYEREMRPQETRFANWEARIVKQIYAGYSELEAALTNYPLTVNQATIAAVTAVNFHEDKHLDVLELKSYPNLYQLWQSLEASDLFKTFPPIGPESMPI